MAIFVDHGHVETECPDPLAAGKGLAWGLFFSLALYAGLAYLACY